MGIDYVLQRINNVSDQISAVGEDQDKYFKKTVENQQAIKNQVGNVLDAVNNFENQIIEKDLQIRDQAEVIKKKDRVIEEKDNIIRQKDREIVEKDGVIGRYRKTLDVYNKNRKTILAKSLDMARAIRERKDYDVIAGINDEVVGAVSQEEKEAEEARIHAEKIARGKVGMQARMEAARLRAKF